MAERKKRKRKTASNIDTTGMSFDQVKAQLVANEPVVTKVPLPDIDFTDDGIMSISGVQVNSDDDMEKKLLRIMGLQPNFVKKFGKLTGADARRALISMLKTAIATQENKKKEILVLGNPTTQIITNLLPGHKDFISNKFAMEQFEEIQSKYPYLQPHQLSMKSDGGFALTLKMADAVTPIGGNGGALENLSGESENYHPGITLINSPSAGITNEIYAWRLICSNGMEGMVKDDGDLKIDQLSTEQLRKFFDQVEGMAQNNFVAAAYATNMHKAITTNASFSEMLVAKKIMEYNSDMPEKEIGSYFPEFVQALRKLAAKGYTDFTKFTSAQLANFITGTSVWDVINRVTDFGSHDYGFNTDFHTVQAKIGSSLFNKESYDADNMILVSGK